jgi:hypothetical protein
MWYAVCSMQCAVRSAVCSVQHELLCVLLQAVCCGVFRKMPCEWYGMLRLGYTSAVRCSQATPSLSRLDEAGPVLLCGQKSCKRVLHQCLKTLLPMRHAACAAAASRANTHPDIP